MYEHGKSDKPIVPKKSANKGVPAQRATPAESMEGRGQSQGQFGSANLRPGRRDGHWTCKKRWTKIREVAVSDKEAKFTSLWHHVYHIERLRQTYRRMKPKAETSGSTIENRVFGTPGAFLADSRDHSGASTGHPETSTDHPETSTGHPETSTGHPETSTGHPETSTGHPETSTDHPETSTGHP